MTEDFRSTVADYSSEFTRRIQNQRDYPDLFLTCPGCVGETFGWCPICLGTRLVTRAEARGWTEPRRKVA